MKYYLNCLLCVLFCYCGSQLPEQVRMKFSQGCPLTLEILKEADQIIRTDRGLILVYNFSKNEAGYDPYLLFFDKKSKLIGASYFPGEKVDSVKRGQIFARLNKYRKDNPWDSDNGFPRGYSAKYILVEENGASTNCSKIIDSLCLDSNFNLTLVIRETSDGSSADYSSFTNVKDSVFNSEFSVRDTLNFPVRELLFYDHRLVNYLFPASNGHFLLDEMIVGKPEILDTIYRQLYDQLRR
ncbi:hypothetical protein [Chitinophaga sp.]|uniref:hypothetical protein n=1 Tax=Chitinophaga sp. TaxID=1869181 RepID=UPI0031CF4005